MIVDNLNYMVCLPKGLYIVNVKFGSEKQILRMMVR